MMPFRRSAGTRRSGYPVAPSPATVDRVLLTVAALVSLPALWQLWIYAHWGL
jgi:hypothetical protein